MFKVPPWFPFGFFWTSGLWMRQRRIHLRVPVVVSVPAAKRSSIDWNKLSSEIKNLRCYLLFEITGNLKTTPLYWISMNISHMCHGIVISANWPFCTRSVAKATGLSYARPWHGSLRTVPVTWFVNDCCGGRDVNHVTKPPVDVTRHVMTYRDFIYWPL